VPVIRVAALIDETSEATVGKALREAGEPLGLRLQPIEMSGAAALAGAVQGLEKTNVDAVVLAADRLVADELRPIAIALRDKRLPSIGPRDFAEIGGLLGYGADLIAQFHRAAYFVDRILNGTKPADLPVEQPDKFDLVINMGTAKGLGLTVPQSFLALADRIIE
jgi:putative ABC transport system substrate-binding protein